MAWQNFELALSKLKVGLYRFIINYFSTETAKKDVDGCDKGISKKTESCGY